MFVILHSKTVDGMPLGNVVILGNTVMLGDVVKCGNVWIDLRDDHVTLPFEVIWFSWYYIYIYNLHGSPVAIIYKSPYRFYLRIGLKM